ncbi:MAG TPA: hypothetical protein VHX66_03995 [Solirubrobacteraceae bacterium]|nr:hypothetical protein [Solirubrobacteraceae bacterium]
MSEANDALPDIRVPGAVGLIGGVVDGGLLAVVAIAASDDAVSVVPLSPSVEQATEWDLEVPLDVLGYRAIAEVWNYGTILPEQCREVVATVTPGTLHALDQLSRAALTGGPVPAQLAVGPPVLDDCDPRLLFQDNEADFAHPFWEPALALAGAATFGEFIRHRRDDLHLGPSELEATAGSSGWLADVEADALDLRQALAPKALARVLRRLQVGATSRLRAITRTTLEGASPQLARGVSGDRPPTGDADSYLDEVFDELRKEWS